MLAFGMARGEIDILFSTSGGDMAKRVDLPQETAGDVIHSVFKGTVSSIPVVGGFVAEVLDHVVAPAISGRVEIWRASIDERITDLEGKSYFTIADLRNNDEFISVAVKATLSSQVEGWETS
jgi:hypothetical protein